MRIAFLCKRHYMGKDVILDRYARLYEIPFQLARLGHEVRGYCLEYRGIDSPGAWMHEASPGSLHWQSRSLQQLKLPALTAYPARLLRELRAFRPDLIIGASDIPHVALTRWLADRIQVPYAIDLYDNFEGFGQARIPGFVSALRWGTRKAALVTTTSEPLRRMVLDTYAPQGDVHAMPSSVDLAVFHPSDKAAARARLGLPVDALLVGTAGGLYQDKGVVPLYKAWQQIAATRPEMHLVLAGPYQPELPPPAGDRVHYLGHLAHAQVADLFCALDVGVISILETAFGRYCFPQKAYEMLACGLPVVAARVGQMETLFEATPQVLFMPGQANTLADTLLRQLDRPANPDVQIQDWEAVMRTYEGWIKPLSPTD